MSQPELPETASPPKRVRNWISIGLILLVLVGLWEVYKAAWTSLEWSWPVRPDNRTMPHSWDVVGALFRPAQRNGPLFLLVESKAALFTLMEALVGFLIGATVGFGLGVWFVHSRLAERAFMPYMVASQAVPILAIAPLVVIWGGKLNMPRLLVVSTIAAYLTFFPVAINTLRGLRSPSPNALEMMKSFAASPRETLWKVRVPAAMPYIFTALKVSAAASVIGAIVGELPSGFRGGIGRDLLQFSQAFTAAPEKMFAAVLLTGLVGVLFVGAVTRVENWWLASRQQSQPGKQRGAQ